MDEDSKNKLNERLSLCLTGDQIPTKKSIQGQDKNPGNNEPDAKPVRVHVQVPIIPTIVNEESGDLKLHQKFDQDKIKIEWYKETKPDIGIRDAIFEKPVERKCWDRFGGMALMIMASVFFSSSVTAVKGLEEYSVFSVAMWITFGSCFVPTVPILLYGHFIQKSRPLQPINPPWKKGNFKTLVMLLIRGFGGCGAIIFQYNALKYLSIADSTVISFSCPVFVTILAYFLFGERFGFINILAVVITLIGVVIITRPPFITGEREMDMDVMTGVGLSLVAMSFITAGCLALRFLKNTHFALNTFFFGVIGTVFCFILSEVFGGFQIPQNSWDWFLCFLMNLFSFGGQVTMTLAFQLEDAGPLSLIRCFDVIFAFILQAIFFSVMPDMFSVLGSLVVLSGVVLIGIRKHVSSLPKEHMCRGMCCWILI